MRRGMALLALALASPACAETFRVQVRGLSQADPLPLAGDYRPPKNAGAPILVLLHGLGSTGGEWQSLLQKAERRGWGAFTYDARGHGESRTTLLGNPVRYEDSRFGRDPLFWREMIEDLCQVMAALKTKKGVGPERIVLLGASLGANICLAAGAREPHVPAAVLLSPGWEYAGVTTETPMRAWTRPLLLVAARPDRYAFQSAAALEKLTPAPQRLTVWALEKGTAKGAHGVQLFDGVLEDRILDWIAQQVRKKG